MSDQMIEQLEEIDALFVQSAMRFESNEDRVMLRGIAPSTVYFSDRPQRVVGHIANSDIVSLWSEGEGGVATDPPNAVLAFVDEGSTMPSDVVITITDPQLDGDDLSYAMTVLEGELPASAAGCTLFIDPFGRPLSPVSVAGMHRRTRRRTRRRVGLAAGR
jgi:hypothetical protein